MLRRSRSVAAVMLAGAMVISLTACAPEDEGTSSSAGSSSSPASCAKGQLKTLTAGKLTVGTDNPAYPPWFVDNKPSNGKGFESALAYAVAGKLGYGTGDVVWKTVTFNNAMAPGAKPYDIDINQFSISAERKKAVDFSSPYYDVKQTVVTTKGSKIARATTVAQLTGAKLGAQVGTTSYKAIVDGIKPDVQPQVFNNNDDAKKALQNGQVDGIVADLPTATYMAAEEIDNGAVLGTLPALAGVPTEQFGIMLDKGSALTACVSKAVDELRADGTLAGLSKEWLADYAAVPALR